MSRELAARALAKGLGWPLWKVRRKMVAGSRLSPAAQRVVLNWLRSRAWRLPNNASGYGAIYGEDDRFPWRDQPWLLLDLDPSPFLEDLCGEPHCMMVGCGPKSRKELARWLPSYRDRHNWGREQVKQLPALGVDEILALPMGARVLVIWGGGNGPHEYTVGPDAVALGAEGANVGPLLRASFVALLER